MEFCSKDFSQKSMKSMVAPSESNASIFEFDGSVKPPPLIPSSFYDGLFFSCA